MGKKCDVMATLLILTMFSDRTNLIREKQFPMAYRHGEDHNSACTLTDDHTLFLLNQQRERRAKVNKRSWWKRLLRLA